MRPKPRALLHFIPHTSEAYWSGAIQVCVNWIRFSEQEADTLNREEQSQEREKAKENPPKRKTQIIRLLRAFKRQYHRYAAEYEKQKSDHAGNERMRALWTKRVGQFTIMLTIIAFLSAGISSWSLRVIQGQLDEMRSSGEDTKALVKAARDSAKAAQDALALSGENAQRQLRAYLSIEESKCSIKSGKAVVIIGLKNSGQTPAYNVKTELLLIPEIPGVDLPKTYITPVISGNIVVGSGTIIYTYAYIASYTSNEMFIDFLKRTKSAIHISGKAEYQDAFGKSHKLKFNLRNISFDGDRSSLQPQEDGNESD